MCVGAGGVLCGGCRGVSVCVCECVCVCVCVCVGGGGGRSCMGV